MATAATMERTERIGLGVAVAAHVLLFAALSASWRTGPEQRFDNPPMAVDIIAETAPVSAAPVISQAPPPPARGEIDGAEEPPPPMPKLVEPPRPAPPVTKKPEPAPAPRPTPRAERQPPRPTPRAESDRRPPRPAAVSTPPRPARPARPTPARPPVGDPLGDIAESVTRTPVRPATPAAGVPAAQTAAQITRSIRTSINAEVARPWNACRVTGADVDQLKTTVRFRLAESGALANIGSVTTTGVTDSNRPQVARFEECARRAIQLAAPFNLPSENYSYWENYTLDFEKVG